MKEITINKNEAGQRLDKLLAKYMALAPKSFFYKMMRKKNITLNGKKCEGSEKLAEGDVVKLFLADETIEKFSERLHETYHSVSSNAGHLSDTELDILYEDQDIILINKPKGMVVHPAPGNPDGTMVNALLWHCAGRLSGIGGAIRPGIVHRIDKDTSGLLVVAKTDAAHQALTEQMSVHSIHRVYHAVVYGNLKEDTGFVEAPIGRDPKDRKKMAVTQQNSKYAYTGWQVLERFGNFTYIACKLKTGRTHQIRVHMASIGHPLAGDAVYGPKNCIRSLNGQCLHAKELGFVHPATGEWMQFDSSLPDWFQDYLSRLRKESRHGAFE